MNAKESPTTWTVLVLDLFHYGDPDEELEEAGFTTWEAARDYARAHLVLRVGPVGARDGR